MGTASSLALLALCACHHAETPQPPEARLSAYLEARPSLQPLDRTSFDRVIVEPFRSLFDDYVAQFRAHPPEIYSMKCPARREYAGDAQLTPAEARLRWVVPVMYPAYVAGCVDAVFVEVDGSWQMLAGLDEALLTRVRALDPTCAARLELAGPAGTCSDVGWVIADAALRGDRPRFDHACALAATACMR